MRLLVTRPEPDASTLAGHLARRGHEALIAPLLEAAFEPVEPDDIAGAQALIATSRNGLRAVGRSPALDVARAIPVFAVGPGTTGTARALGFSHVVQGPKSARELLRVIAAMADINGGPLVHLAGETIAFDLAGELQKLGFHVHQPIVYRMRAVDALSGAAVARIREGALEGVILLSPQTATIYARLIAAHDLVRPNKRLTHFCLSPAVAERLAGLDVERLAVAAHPSLEEMLALVGTAAAQ